MRRLLIGLSSPVAYSYMTERDQGRPCPILESPISYCLFYDELWFLSRALCPFELETLPFVHFVDEEYSPKLPFAKLPESAMRPLDNWNWDEFQNTVDLITGDGRHWRCDNHARRLNFAGVSVLPTPGISVNLFIDRFIATEFNFDLAENTPNSKASADLDTQTLNIAVSEQLVRSRLACLRAPFGFWHPCLNDLRSDRFLKDFRTKIMNLDFTHWSDLDAKVAELNAEYEAQLRKSLRDRFSPMEFVYSTAAFIFGVIPGVGTVTGAADWLRVGKNPGKNPGARPIYLNNSRREVSSL